MQQINSKTDSLYSQIIKWSPSYNGRRLDLTVRLMRITPSKARELIRTMETNRNKRTSALRKMKLAISVGKWFPTGDTIKLCKEGTLLDGLLMCPPTPSQGML